MSAEQLPSNHTIKAVIYCRVSSRAQEAEGHGLESQETRCRQHAAASGYEVAAVFPDTITGGGDFMQRPGMVALLSFLDAQPAERFVAIFDDLKRFARDTRFHLDLRKAFRLRRAKIECLNFKFDDTPEGSSSKPSWQRRGLWNVNKTDAKLPRKCAPVWKTGIGYIIRPLAIAMRQSKGAAKCLSLISPSQTWCVKPLKDMLRVAFRRRPRSNASSKACRSFRVIIEASSRSSV